MSVFTRPFAHLGDDMPGSRAMSVAAATNKKPARRSSWLRFRGAVAEFCADTSIHGLGYFVRPGEPILGRIVWLFMVGCGFALTTVVFRSTYLTWESGPSITTIGSATKSIRSLPFPTAVVYPDPSAQIDAAAYPEKIMDFLTFDCATHYGDGECEGADAIRREFDFVLRHVVASLAEVMLGLGDRLENSDLVPRDIFRNDDPAAGTVDRILLNDLASYADLFENLLDNIGKVQLPQYYREMADKFGLRGHHPNSTCDTGDNSTACSQVRVMRALSEAILTLDKSVPFGALFFAAAPFLDPNLFSRIERKYWRDLDGPPYSGEVVVSEAGDKIHGLLASAGAVLFPNSPKIRGGVSVYDVPLIFGRHPVGQLFGRSIRDGFPYSYFKLNPDGGADDYEDFLFCPRPKEESLYFGEADPCQTEQGEICCLTKNLINVPDLPSLMSVMSHSRHKANSHEDYLELISPFTNDRNESRLAQFPMNRPGKGVWALEGKRSFPRGRDHYSMAPFCKFESGERVMKFLGKKDSLLSDCAQLRPVSTDAGICHGFNVLGLFKESPFTDAVEKAYGYSTGDSDDLVQSVPHGFVLGLTVMLNRQTAFRNEWRGSGGGPATRGGFEISVGSHLSSFLFNGKKRAVRLGYHTTLTVKPFVVKADEALRNLPVEDRECLFPEEKPLALLKQYSQAGCQHECLMAEARSRCGCTPWDFPFPADESDDHEHEVCDYLGYYCFDEVMSNVSMLESACGGCVADCDILEYEVAESTVPFDVDDLCSGITWATAAINWSFRHRRMPQLVYLYDRIVLGEETLAAAGTDDARLGTDAQEEICRRVLLEDVALVTVETASQHYVENRRTVRVSVTEKIAVFGGTLGLFTGMSFLGMFEVVYWICKAALPRKFSPSTKK